MKQQAGLVPEEDNGNKGYTVSFQILQLRCTILGKKKILIWSANWMDEKYILADTAVTLWSTSQDNILEQLPTTWGKQWDGVWNTVGG